MSVDVSGTAPLGGGIHVKRGVELSDSMLAYLRRVRRRLSFDVVVTSGIRTPRSQAQAWRAKLDLGQTRHDLLALYRRDDLVREVFAAGDLSVEGITKVFEQQIARGDHLSSHMSARALDLRVHGYDAAELEALDEALVAEGGRVVTEAVPPHKHVELTGASDRVDQAPPYVEPRDRPDVEDVTP